MKPIHISLAFLLGGLFMAGAAQERQPNIVFILADDMGYGDVHALNPASAIPTPNLDRLANEGMTFTDAHTPSAVCTPTRYGLLTGRYCWRGRLKRGVLNGYGTPLIEPGRPTVASFLKQQGYRTGIVGKWHLGLNFSKDPQSKEIDYTRPVEDGPNTLGFDFSHIIPASLDFPPYVYIRDGRVTEPKTVMQPAQSFPAYLRQGPRSEALVMENCLDDLLAQATDFIRRSSAADRPFFLYFPLTAPHKPVLPHPRFRGRTKLGPYGDFIVQVDWTVGEVLKTLEETQAAQDTLVIQTSDNGSFMYRLDDPQAPDHVSDPTIQTYRASHHRANGPLRGTKADVWEAGHRVPFFARWPGVVRARSKCDTAICLTDFFATAADITGGKLPDDGAEDSFSFLPLLKGEKLEVPRPPVINHSANGMFAVRSNAWKLVLGNGSGGREQPAGKPFAKPYWLSDLEKDIGETVNLAEKNPETADRLEQAAELLRTAKGSRTQ